MELISLGLGASVNYWGDRIRIVPPVGKPVPSSLFVQFGRGDRIRTCDLLLPKQAR